MEVRAKKLRVCILGRGYGLFVYPLSFVEASCKSKCDALVDLSTCRLVLWSESFIHFREMGCIFVIRQLLPLNSAEDENSA